MDSTNINGIEQKIIDKEKDALNSWAEASIIGYTKHFDNEATYVDDIMAQNRIDGLTDLQAYANKLDGMNMIKKHRYDFVNPKVQVMNDVVILSFQYHPYDLQDNSPLTKWKATSVYAFKDNDWKVVHANWSLLNKE